jgi:hypothetical protein
MILNLEQSYSFDSGKNSNGRGGASYPNSELLTIELYSYMNTEKRFYYVY